MNIFNWMMDNTFFSIFIGLFIIVSVTFFINIINSFFETESTPKEKFAFPYEYQFPDIVNQRWKAKYPHLTDLEFSLAQKSLLQFFEVLYYNKTSVAMVSEIADELWHEFILHTKAYCEFCEATFGKYIHHNPTENNVEYDWSNKDVPVEMLNLYKFSLNSPLNTKEKTPLIFTVDNLLKISSGYRFDLQRIEHQHQEEMKSEAKEKKNSSGNCSSCSGCGGD